MIFLLLLYDLDRHTEGYKYYYYLKTVKILVGHARKTTNYIGLTEEQITRKKVYETFKI